MLREQKKEVKRRHLLRVDVRKLMHQTCGRILSLSAAGLEA